MKVGVGVANFHFLPPSFWIKSTNKLTRRIAQPPCNELKNKFDKKIRFLSRTSRQHAVDRLSAVASPKEIVDVGGRGGGDVVVDAVVVQLVVVVVADHVVGENLRDFGY